ncbi:MAG: hypothetical protein SNJ75_12655 [Gemmataceae bacterium]
MRSTKPLLLSVMTLSLLGVLPVYACGKPNDKQVRVSVIVILASETDSATDPKLESLAAEIRKTKAELKGFRLLKMACKSLPLGKADEFDLIEDQRATIKIKSTADKMDRVRLEVSPPSMGKITYSTPCGKFLPIVTPFKTKKGEHLLLAIRVQPCGEENPK